MILLISLFISCWSSSNFAMESGEQKFFPGDILVITDNGEKCLPWSLAYLASDNQRIEGVTKEGLSEFIKLNKIPTPLDEKQFENEYYKTIEKYSIGQVGRIACAVQWATSQKISSENKFMPLSCRIRDAKKFRIIKEILYRRLREEIREKLSSAQKFQELTGQLSFLSKNVFEEICLTDGSFDRPFGWFNSNNDEKITFERKDRLCALHFLPNNSKDEAALVMLLNKKGEVFSTLDKTKKQFCTPPENYRYLNGAFSQNGLSMAARSGPRKGVKNDTIELWNLATFQKVWSRSITESCNDTTVVTDNGLVFFGDYNAFYVVSSDGTEQKKLSIPHYSIIENLCCTSNGELLALTSAVVSMHEDTRDFIHIYDVEYEKVKQNISADGLKSFYMNPLDKTMVTSHKKNMIHLWDERFEQPVQTFHHEHVENATLNNASTLIMSAGNQYDTMWCTSKIYIWDMRVNDPVAKLEGSGDRGIVFDQSGEYVAYADLFKCKIATLKPLMPSTLAHCAVALTHSYTPSYQYPSHLKEAYNQLLPSKESV